MPVFRCKACDVNWPEGEVVRVQRSVVGSAVCTCAGCGGDLLQGPMWSVSEKPRRFEAWYRGWDRRRRGPSPEEGERERIRRQVEAIRGLEEAA